MSQRRHILRLTSPHSTPARRSRLQTEIRNRINNLHAGENPGRAAPYRHLCRDCRSPFDSERKRDSLCWFCKYEIEELDERLWNAIWPFLPGPNNPSKRKISNKEFHTILEIVEEHLACPWRADWGYDRCGWIGNSNRRDPQNQHLNDGSNHCVLRVPMAMRYRRQHAAVARMARKIWVEEL